MTREIFLDDKMKILSKKMVKNVKKKIRKVYAEKKIKKAATHICIYSGKARNLGFTNVKKNIPKNKKKY